MCRGLVIRTPRSRIRDKRGGAGQSHVHRVADTPHGYHRSGGGRAEIKIAIKIMLMNDEAPNLNLCSVAETRRSVPSCV
jgi:hypothetical protein